MSVVFATFTKDFIVLCADKQATNLKNGEISSQLYNKVEKWSPTIGIAFSGATALAIIIKDAVFDYLNENGINNFTLEEIADWFCQGYYAAIDEYPDMPKTLVAHFLIAGILSNGFPGVIQVTVGNENADIDINEAKDIPGTLILAPDDCPDYECNNLFQKAIINAKKKCKYYQDPLEVAHKKAVKYVSEHSKYVSAKSDYVKITFNNL